MAEVISGSTVVVSRTAATRTAVLVLRSGKEAVLCPFFRKCDGVLVIDAVDGSSEFHHHDRDDSKSLSKLILKLKPQQLVCGFVGDQEKRALRSAGIDVRLGSCNCSVDQLVAGFSDLPEA